MDHKLEFRFAVFEVRQEGDHAIVEGAAMPYGAKANIAGAFTETVQPGAFAGRMADVVCNYMHRRSEPVARTDGGGLTLTDSAERLIARVEIPAYRKDIIDQVKRKILRGFSVEMFVQDEAWPEPDQRVIKQAQLSGIALVDTPAYGDATMAVAERMRQRGTASTSLPPLVV